MTVRGKIKNGEVLLGNPANAVSNPASAEEPLLMDLDNARGVVRRLLQEEATLAELAKFLAESSPGARSIFIVGGALRDLFLTPRRPPKDIDVILDGVASSSLSRINNARRNFFGGLSLTFRGLAVDMWLLEETYHLKEFALQPTIEGFLEGAPFNLDKIAYDLKTTRLYDRGCLAGVALRQIIYAPARPYLESIQAARAVLLQWKTGFEYDVSCVALLQRVDALLQDRPAEVADIKRYLQYLKQFYEAEVFEHVIAAIHDWGKRAAVCAQARRRLPDA
jgi:hypothetical protein